MKINLHSLSHPATRSTSCNAVAENRLPKVFAHAVTLVIASLAFLLAGTRAVWASDPVGIYALVDKVVLEPTDAAPERIQIWGAFALAEGSGYKYKPAERGCLYFKLVPDKPTVCRNEWADLKSVAGTGQIVSFGSRYQEKCKVRTDAAKLESPDVYPLAMGVGKVRKEKDYAPIVSLIKLQDSKSKEKKESQAPQK